VGDNVKTSAQRLGLRLIVGTFVLAAVPASAQELSLGYQWQRFSLAIDDSGDFPNIDESLTAPFGLNFDVAIPIPGNFDVVGQLDWSRWSESAGIFGTSVSASANFTTFGGGIRWSSLASPRVTPFVQGLFGATRVTFGCDITGFDCEEELEEFLGQDASATDLMFQFGGGVAIPMGGWSVVSQLDYRRFFAEDESISSIRFVGGVRLGTR
jgi:hypothetical protein